MWYGKWVECAQSSRGPPCKGFVCKGSGSGTDDLYEVLEGKGKLLSRWADSLNDVTDVGDTIKVSENDASSVGEHLGLPVQCDWTCGTKIDARGTTLTGLRKWLRCLLRLEDWLARP